MTSTSMSASYAASLPDSWKRFRNVWHVDFEFAPDRNRLPAPICMHALEHRTGREIAVWRDELLTTTCPPFDIGPDDVVIAYSAVAEAVCMQRLRWRRPNIICPFTELMALNNGI